MRGIVNAIRRSQGREKGSLFFCSLFFCSICGSWNAITQGSIGIVTDQLQRKKHMINTVWGISTRDHNPELHAQMGTAENVNDRCNFEICSKHRVIVWKGVGGVVVRVKPNSALTYRYNGPFHVLIWTAGSWCWVPSFKSHLIFVFVHSLMFLQFTLKYTVPY